MEQEIWKPVVGYEGLYEVSNMGRVKRLGGTPKCKEDRILKPRRHYGADKPYYSAALFANGIGSNFFVHRLVLLAFVGPCPEGMEACHNNGDPSDNRLSNLRWDYRANNAADKILHGTSTRGEKNATAKLTKGDVREIRQMRARGMKQRDIAAAFGVSPSAVSSISTGRKWGWLE